MDEKQLQEAYAEMPEILRQEFEGNETIKGLLTESDEKTVTIRIGTIDVKVLAAPPKQLRRELIKYQRLCQMAQKVGEGDGSEDMLTTLESKLNDIESQLYPMLGQMVVSPAMLKRPEVWAYLDQQQGLAIQAYQMIMETINERGEDIKKFRRKQRGAVPPGSV